jgi:hypothetical protein
MLCKAIKEGHQSPGTKVAFAPPTRQRTIDEYASHCDEHTRQMQHELANCTAVQLIDIRVPKS